MLSKDSISSGGGVESSTGGIKRRKCGTNSEAKLEKLIPACQPTSQSEYKILEENLDIGLQKKSPEQICDPKLVHHAFLNGTDDYLHQHWRSILQNLSLSFGADQGGMSWIEGCMRDALCTDAQTDYVKAPGGDGDSLEVQCHAHQASAPMKSIPDVEGHSVLTDNGSLSKLNNLTISKQCQRAFIRLIMSDKFVSLCKLFSENFHEVKFDKVIDMTILDLRMKEGGYEQCPALFKSDLQEVWRKVYVLGTEMISLAKSLSDLSRLHCCEMGGSIGHGTSDEKHEFSWLPYWVDRREQPNASLWRAYLCRQCGENSDGKDCLVCDSCEEMFHVSCIMPPVKGIPQADWYCAKCIELGIDSSHGNGVTCKKLNVPAGTIDVEDGTIPEQPSASLWITCRCRLCGEKPDRESCLVCDSCEEMFHISCIRPPVKQIPLANWYCAKCTALGIDSHLEN